MSVVKNKPPQEFSTTFCSNTRKQNRNKHNWVTIIKNPMERNRFNYRFLQAKVPIKTTNRINGLS